MKKNKIKYTKNVLWLKPFIEASSKLISLDKVTIVRGYKVPIGYEEQAYASVIKRDRKYSINIKIYDLVDGSTRHLPSRYSIVLDSLAHELAHIRAGFDHTPEHYELTCRIALIFSRILKKYGIIDTSKRIKISKN